MATQGRGLGARLESIMHPNIAKLVTLLPPPENKRYNTGDWSEVERELGSGLPRDFKEFVELYGSVEICNWLWFHTPFSFREGFSEILTRSLRQIDAVVGGRQNVPYPDHPLRPGLLPIGATEDGDIIAWITKGDPDDWGVFVWLFPGLKTFVFESFSVTSFVLDLLDGTSPLFDAGLAAESFQPEYRCVNVVG
jgi:SMI1 / KNR4 family (SUKH-1)